MKSKASKNELVDFEKLKSHTYAKCWVVNIYWLTDSICFRSPVATRWVSAVKELHCDPSLKENKDVMGSQLRDTYYATEEAAWREADRQFKEWCAKRSDLIERRGKPPRKPKRK